MSNDQPNSFTTSDFVTHPYLAARIEDVLQMEGMLKRFEGRDGLLLRRMAGHLRPEEIVFVAEAVRITENYLIRYVPNFGRQMLNTLKTVVATINLHLGSDFLEFPREKNGLYYKEVSYNSRKKFMDDSGSKLEHNPV